MMAIDHDFERSIHQSREPAPAGSLFETFADKVVRRAAEVVSGKRCAFPPSEKQKQFLWQLRSHQGASRAVPLGHLAERLRCNPRELKAIVQELRMSFGVQIGSSRGEDNGYFLIATAEEAFEATGPMYQQAITMLQVVRRVRGEAQSTQQLLSQLSLDLEEVLHG